MGAAVGPDLGPGGRDHLALLSAIANFLFIPYYPFWSPLIITLDVS